MGIVQDTLTAARKLTRRDCFVELDDGNKFFFSVCYIIVYVCSNEPSAFCSIVERKNPGTVHFEAQALVVWQTGYTILLHLLINGLFASSIRMKVVFPSYPAANQLRG
jgi:hypothetical protein